jgi:predicted DsbA family dithiol-disulfide isomerase
MDAVCWSDYLCPWCYVGQHRDGLLASLGVAVSHRPYELHPEIPTEGRAVRPDGRLRTTFDRIEAACDEIGMAFRRPTRMPNTRLALESAEWVRIHHAEAFTAMHRGLFAAQFVTGDRLDDPDVVHQVIQAAGAPAAEVSAAVEAGRAAPLLARSMAEARALGVTSTPTWSLGGMLIPGALDPATMERWITKVVARHDRADDVRPTAGG